MENALSWALSGDTVNVASGKYRAQLRFGKTVTLTLLGGWDATFTTRDPVATPTILKGRAVRTPYGTDKRVVLVIANTGESIALTLDGFVLTAGKARVVYGFGILGQSQQDGGGGLYVLSAGGNVAVTVQRSAITGNRSKIIAGGGVFVGAGPGGTADVTFDRTTITDNQVDYGGGIEVMTYQGALDPSASAHVRVVNSIIARNRTEGSSAIFALQFGGQTVLDLVDSTVTANVEKPEKGDSAEGAIVLNQSTANITNTILWGNLLGSGAPDIDLDVGQTATANMSYTDLGTSEAVFGGVLNDLGGNLSVDPQLAGFELAATSPLIDAGTCVGAPSEDFEGDPRPSGAACDVGADEFVP